MDLYQIDIPGGYSGPVQVQVGQVKFEFPTARGEFGIKRKNLEFNIVRSPDGEWCDYGFLQLDPTTKDDAELREAAKKEINKMRI